MPRDNHFQARWLGTPSKVNFEESGSLVALAQSKGQDKTPIESDIPDISDDESLLDQRIDRALTNDAVKKYPIIRLTLELLRGNDVSKLLADMGDIETKTTTNISDDKTTIVIPEPAEKKLAPSVSLLELEPPVVEKFIPYFVDSKYITNDNESVINNGWLEVTATLMKPPPSGSIMLFPFGEAKRKLSLQPVDMTFDYDDHIVGILKSVTTEDAIVVHELVLDDTVVSIDEIVFPITCKCKIKL